MLCPTDPVVRDLRAPEMKAPTSVGAAPANSGEGERKTINSELWHACAGPLVSLPPVGSLVVYFPQGHSEQVAASMQKGANAQIPNYPNLPSKLICMLHNVTLHADAETDEVYAQMTLQPVNKFDKEALLASDLGLKQSRQPTEFFCKTLTASDTSTHGGFSVPRRAAEKIFPPLDFSMQPPAQELGARDLHDVSWTFRHIYRGQPKRHLLTTGWSVFVSAKRLVAGDSVLFIRDDKSQLLLGIRRANRQQPAISSSVLSSDSMHIGILAAAAHAAANHSPFTVFYNPRASPSEFVVPFAKYHKSVYGTQISLGMRFRMMFETEESSVRRYMGTITGISDLDPLRWKNSHWRNLQVGWDESTAGERQNRVSLWEIEPVITPFFLCPPPFFRPKCFRQPGMPGEESEIENAFKNAMPWLTDDIGIKDVQNPIQHGMSLVQWMNMQQNPQILGSVNQADCFPSITPSQLHNVGVDDPSKQLALQGHVLPLPNLQFGLPNLQQQTQQLDGLQQQNRTLANPYAQPQKPGIAGQQLQQQQQQLLLQQQQQRQQQQVSQAALQGLTSQPLTQSQLQNQLLQQNFIQSKLQQQQLLGVNQQHLLLSNQNPLQSSLPQQNLQFQNQIPEQQQSLVQQQQQQQQLPLAANQLQLQLLQKLRQQQQLQQSQSCTNMLPQQIPPLQAQLQSQLISPAHQQSQQQQQQQEAPWQQQQQQQQPQQHQQQQQLQQLQPQQMNPSFHQIGGTELFHSLPNQPPPRPPHQEGQLVSPSPQSLPVSSQLLPASSQLLPVSASHLQAPTKGSVPARADSVFTDDDSRSSSTSPLANNRSASSSFINRGQQCSVRIDDPKRAVNNNLVQEPQLLKANPQIKHEFLPKQEMEQVSSQLPSRNNTTDYLDATSCTSFCLEGGQQNVRTTSFPPSSAILRDSNPDGDIQVDPRNNLLFGVNIDGPLPASLESDTLFPNGFGSAKDLQNLISSYNTPRDIEPELSTSAICSQSFGVQDMSFQPGCSNGAAVNEAGFINKSSRPQALQRVRTFTKVYKRGSVGRSIDVTRYKGYDELRHDLACRFGIQGQLEDPQTSCWKLVYVDHENDILLVGDDPWEEFVGCVQSIKILSTAEVQQMSLDGDLGNMQIPNQTCSGSQENTMWRGYCEDNSGNHSLASFDH